MIPHYNVIVLGLGAMGSATLYHLSELKKREGQALSILGIDQHVSPHTYGSSHGDTRIIRRANSRSEKYIKLAERSVQLFEELATKTAPKFGELYVKTGGILLDSTRDQEFSLKTKLACERLHISHHHLTNEDIRHTYPQFKVSPSTEGIFEEGMGYLRPEKCIEAQLDLAKANGAQIQTGEKITHFEERKDGLIEVVAENGHHYLTDKLIVCAGPWVNDFISRHGGPQIKIYRKVLFWFEIEDGCLENFKSENFPVYIWYLDPKNIVYGFPLLESEKAVKIAVEETLHYEDPYQPICPETVNRQVSSEEKTHMFERFVQPYFRGITKNCTQAKTCMYSAAPNWDFVIDFLPDSNKKIIIASPCAGAGFKFSAAIGEGLAAAAVEGRNELMEEFGGLS